MAAEADASGASDARHRDGDLDPRDLASMVNLSVDERPLAPELEAVRVACRKKRLPALRDAVHAVFPLTDTWKELVDVTGVTPLHVAAQLGDVELVRTLLTQWRIPAEAKTNAGSTPLHFAAMEGQTGTMSVLISEASVNANARDMNGWTPLHLAAYDLRHEAVALLLATPGVRIAAQNDDGATAAMLVEENTWGEQADRDAVVGCFAQAMFL
eukprot:c1614_g1_i1.p1 GENE.c1614_g1_i1~~c1614_g1_i1.p1  ORF type:complete len:213 (+),score=31.32 c1614_g1_i1:109-747(+)